ncbi:MAG: PAS domain S-box protein, partial [Rhodoferax sp.]|nr:PAS domain S-box protein [Rhodoferax sp.]
MPKTAKSQSRNLIQLLGAAMLFALLGAIAHQFSGMGERVSNWRYLIVLAFVGTALASYTAGRRRGANTRMKHTVTLRNRALDEVQEGVTLGNLKGELAYVNDAFVKLTGYSREELLGKPFGKMLLGPDTKPATAELMRTSLNTGKPFQAEILNCRKDGTAFWNELSITPLFDEGGVLIEYFGVQRDITAQKEAAQALRKSQAQLSLVLKGSNDGLWDWNIADDTIERSLSWYQMLGYDAQGIPSHRVVWPQIVHPGDLARINQEMDRLLAGEQDRYCMELRLRHKDGHYVPVLSRGYIQRDNDDRATHVCGTTTNLSDQKIRESKLSLAVAVFQQSREGITMTDANRNIIMVNKAFTEITGYTEAEVLGKNPRVLASGRHGPEFYRAMWEAINTNGYWAGEIWDRRKDGAVYPAWLAISAMRDEQGQITNYLGNFSDLSDTKAAESRIQWLSHFDALTGLPNHTLLRDRTAHSISVVRRASEPLAMMLVGIDHFKTVNDTLDHRAGDELLVEIAKRLSNSVRAQDTVARLGGKEFVLVLPGTPVDGAAHLAAELLQKLAQPYRLDDHELTLTASIGIASYPDSGNDFDSLFKAVEFALHHAQANGRDTFQFYS